MGRRARKKEELVELNLAPIMNLVMILIPLLLLSVVFEQMGVINVSAPKLSVGPETQEPKEDEKPPLQLTIGISTSGFTIAATGSKLPPLQGCPSDGPATICPKAGKDIAAVLVDVGALRKQYDSNPLADPDRTFIKRSDEKLQEAIESYDWRQLYNTLILIKQKFPEETVVNVGAGTNVPFEILVKVMDTVRYKLDSSKEDGTFDNPEAFATAVYKENSTAESQYAELFNDVVLAVIQ
jgi:biopolymer transport protein ExbD